MLPYRPTTNFHSRFDSAMESGSDEAFSCVQRTVEEAGTPNTYEPDEDGFSGLYWVCLRGHFRAAEWLLSQGAEPNGDNGGKLPGALLAAVAGENPDVVRLLIDAGADVNALDVQNDTPILKAVKDGNVDVCDLLLRAGADPTIGNIAGVSALTTRLHADRKDEFTELFRRYGYAPEFNIYEKTGKQRFEEWLAARRGTAS